MAVCLLESGSDDDDEKNSSDVEMTNERRSKSKEEAAKMMVRVPCLRQKIAGKSIPLEVRSPFHLFIKFHLTLLPFRNSSHVKPVNSNRKTNTSLSPLSN